MTNKVIYNDNVLIDLTSDTIDAENLMSGYTAHDKTGTLITGTLDPFKPQIIAIMQGYQEGSAYCLSPSNQQLPVKFHEADTWVWDIPSYGQYTVTFSGPAGHPSQIVNVTAVQIYRVEMNVAITFEQASWSFIDYVASRGKAADYWAVGDKKSFTDASSSSTTRYLEIVDFTDTNIILDFVTPYKSGPVVIQTGQTSGYPVDWYNDYIAATLPQDFKNVLSGTPTLFTYNEIFGSDPYALFSTSAGRVKGVTWWTGTSQSSGSSPSTSANYCVNATGSSSSTAMTNTAYYNPKFVI